MPKWTQGQQEAIDSRNKNLLVSAAAGSGKTAVLVERVMREVTDPDATKRRDIDSLVIVTFTKAAASEMRERLRKRLQEQAEKDPSDAVVRRQLMLLPDALICTIDSFCLKVVREHYTEIDLDPGFHTGDENECVLLRADVLDEMFEEYYAADRNRSALPGEVSFTQLSDVYGDGKDDRALADCISMIYDRAQSMPWPQEWLEQCEQMYQQDADTVTREGLVADRLTEMESDLRAKFGKKDEIKTLYALPGLERYQKSADHCLDVLQTLLTAFESKDKTAFKAGFAQYAEKKALPGGKLKAGTDLAARDVLKGWITATRQAIESFQLLYQGAEGIGGDLKKMAPYAKKLIEVTKDFAVRFEQAKQDRGILSFSDIEHKALQILAGREDGKTVYTRTADELSDSFSEILIDEYQDSNRLQEEILLAVSRTRRKDLNNNITMVGDLKQSIYRFRQADPELFAQKSRNYPTLAERADADLEKVMLNRNFRSRRGVIDSVNAVFADVMSDAAGGTEYGKEEALQFGFAPYEEVELPALGKTFTGKEGRTEVHLIEQDVSADGKNAQAILIARRIRELLDGGYQVYDTHLSGYRPIRKGDIAIVSRAASGTAPQLVKTLSDAGIDCYAESRSGFFAAWEIRQIVDLLRLIDDPLNDIPAAAAMLSYFGGFSADELARVRLYGRTVRQEGKRKVRKDQLLWPLLKAAGEDGGHARSELVGQELADKCLRFTRQIDAWRADSRVLSIHDLVWELVYNEGFYRYAGTLPSGRRRMANLDHLLNYAGNFDQTGYHGLFQFLRYISMIDTSQDTNLGERSAVREDDDVVRIMTIHKSKGLEFPVVFVMDLGRRYNMRLDNANILTSRDAGLILKTIDASRRVKYNNLLWNLEKEHQQEEDLSEEMRLLYVAMTRAREKLILVGAASMSSEEKKAGVFTRWDAARDSLKQGPRSPQEILKGKDYLDLIMPTVLSQRESSQEPLFVLSETKAELLSDEGLKGVAPQTEHLSERAETSQEQVQAPTWWQEKYPYALHSRQKPKVSVSEIKRQLFEEEQEDFEQSSADFLKTAEKEEKRIPNFLLAQKKYSAAQRGTAYHRVMQLLDFSRAGTKEQIMAQIEAMVKSGRLEQKAADVVRPEQIVSFFETELGKRAAAAAAAGKIHREQQFLFERQYEDATGAAGAKAAGTQTDGTQVAGTQTDGQAADSDDLQLVQGVIDLYFEEEDGIVLVDFKTDFVKPKDGEELLKKRYGVQLALYAQALEGALGKPVKAKYLYSFSLQKEVLSE